MRTQPVKDISRFILPPQPAPSAEMPLAGGEEMHMRKMSAFRTLPRTDTWEQPYDNEMAKLFWHLIPIERCCALFYHISHAPSG